jgi:hypothetical protein
VNLKDYKDFSTVRNAAAFSLAGWCSSMRR